MTQIYNSNFSTPGGDHVYYLDGRVTNEGTRGNVIVTAELVNATNQTAMTRSSRTVYMLEGEPKSVNIPLSGLAGEPYAIRFIAQRK
jgi:hypothetical protein